MAEPKIWMNGKLVPQAEAVLPVNSAAVFYATNVFEGLRAYWNETDDQLYCFRLDEHFARFRESMKMMRFTVPYSDADLHARRFARAVEHGQSVSDSRRALRLCADRHALLCVRWSVQWHASARRQPHGSRHWDVGIPRADALYQ